LLAEIICKSSEIDLTDADVRYEDKKKKKKKKKK
jgi:hypothetical protein